MRKLLTPHGGRGALLALFFILVPTLASANYGKLFSKHCYIVQEGTGKGRERTGRGYEANPLLGWAFRSSTVVGLGVCALIKGVYAYMVGRSVSRLEPKAKRTLLGVLDAFFFGIVIHNLWILF